MTSVTVQSSAKQQCQNAFGSSQVWILIDSVLNFLWVMHLKSAQGCSPVPCLQTPPPPSAV